MDMLAFSDIGRDVTIKIVISLISEKETLSPIKFSPIWDFNVQRQKSDIVDKMVDVSAHIQYGCREKVRSIDLFSGGN
jgi:hypothetical protein